MKQVLSFVYGSIIVCSTIGGTIIGSKNKTDKREIIMSGIGGGLLGVSFGFASPVILPLGAVALSSNFIINKYVK